MSLSGPQLFGVFAFVPLSRGRQCWEGKSAFNLILSPIPPKRRSRKKWKSKIFKCAITHPASFSAAVA